MQAHSIRAKAQTTCGSCTNWAWLSLLYLFFDDWVIPACMPDVGVDVDCLLYVSEWMCGAGSSAVVGWDGWQPDCRFHMRWVLK